jgi:hypothetical protein
MGKWSSFVPLDEWTAKGNPERIFPFLFQMPGWNTWPLTVRSECQACANRAAFDNDCP